MKHCILLLCSIFACCFLLGQEFPKGVWAIVTDGKGNPVDTKSSNSPRQLSRFDFQEGMKYSFSFEEYDSLGRKTVVVKENGVYSVTGSQFQLTPKASTTSFYDYLPKSAKPIGNSVKQNPLNPASYTWIYEKTKVEKLTIEAVNPGYREGLVSGGAKARKPLPADVRRSLARSL